MKSLLKKMTAVLMVSVIVLGCVGCQSPADNNVTAAESTDEVSLSLWYTDNNLTPYISFAANRYHVENPLITIVPHLVSADDYLENIYNSTIKENYRADLFMLSSDNLEKAYLMGLAAENDMYSSIYTDGIYGKAGIEASKYNNKLLGYPLSFDTSVMVYNKKYGQPLNTFADITDFSNNFQHTDENADLKVIVQWDVSDAITNYAFVAKSLNIGGAGSDNKNEVKVNSALLKEELEGFAKFKSDYGIDRKTMNESDSVKLFTQNKLLYSIVKSDDLKDFNEVGIDYGIVKIPDISNTLKTNTISSTDLVMVSPYSSRINIAKNVAKAFSYDYAGDLYELTGTPSARGDLTNDPTSEYKNLRQIYSDSIVKAQFMKIGDFYIKLEIMLHQVWDGNSIDEVQKTFENYIGVINSESSTANAAK